MWNRANTAIWPKARHYYEPRTRSSMMNRKYCGTLLPSRYMAPTRSCFKLISSVYKANICATHVLLPCCAAVTSMTSYPAQSTPASGQYVILGAGLDTSPYRPSHASRTLAVFEVDHPDTQRWKLEKLSQAGIRIPANLRHVAIDFERQTLADELAANGFDSNVPTFFSWLGVTYYLRRESVFDTFRFVAKMPPGSQIVFDFTLADSELDAEGLQAYAIISQHLNRHGEPWLARFAPGTLEDDLKNLGFSQVCYFSQELAWAALSERSHGRPVAEYYDAVDVGDCLI